MHPIFIVWKKELSDAIRDRRTLFSLIFVPMLLMPVMIIGMNKLMASQMKTVEKAKIKVGVVNAPEAPELMQFLKENKELEIITLDKDLPKAVKNKMIDVGIAPIKGFTQLAADLKPIRLEVYSDSTSMQSSGMTDRLRGILKDFDKKLVEDRIKKTGQDLKILSTIQYDLKDVASERERGGFGLGFILPLIIVMWSIAGGQSIAIDVSAGEKERKTLEPLLLTSVNRMDIIWGKLLAVSTGAAVTVVISLFSMLAAFIYIGFSTFSSGAPEQGGAQPATSFSIDPTTMVILLVTSLVMIVMFSGLYLSVSIFAKSYKEAQSYAGIIYLVLILPVAILNAIPTLSTHTGFFFIPVVNSAMLFKEVLIGKLDFVHIGITLATLILCAVISVFAATRVYNREDVLVG